LLFRQKKGVQFSKHFYFKELISENDSINFVLNKQSWAADKGQYLCQTMNATLYRKCGDKTACLQFWNYVEANSQAYGGIALLRGKGSLVPFEYGGCQSGGEE
jgi:hypothetical protein